MNKLLRQKSHHYFYLLVSTLYILPQLWSTKTNIWDDPATIRDSIAHGILREAFFNSDRFRPMYYFYRHALFLYFRDNMMLWFITSIILLAATLYLIHKILNKYSINTNLAFIAPLLILLIPTTTENFYRLGTAEPLQGVFLLASILAIINKNTSRTLIFTVLLYLAKETSVFFIPVLLLLAYQQKNKKLLKKLYALSTLYILYLIYFFIHRTGHALSFQPSTSLLFLNFKGYINFHGRTITLLLIIITSSLLSLKKNISRDPLLVFILGIIFTFPALLFFKNINGFYIYPAILFSVIATTIFFKRASKTKKVLLGFLILPLIISFTPNIVETQKFWHSEYVLNGVLSSYLLSSNEVTLTTDTRDRENIDNFRILFSKYETVSITYNSRVGLFTSSSLTPTTRLIKKYKQNPVGPFITQYPENFPEDEYTITPLCASTPFMKYQCKWYVIEAQN